MQPMVDLFVPLGGLDKYIGGSFDDLLKEFQDDADAGPDGGGLFSMNEALHELDDETVTGMPAVSNNGGDLHLPSPQQQHNQHPREPQGVYHAHYITAQQSDRTRAPKRPAGPRPDSARSTASLLDRVLYGARFSTGISNRGVPLSFTPLLRLKREHACEQWHSSRAFTPLTGWHCKLCPNTEDHLQNVGTPAPTRVGALEVAPRWPVLMTSFPT